MFEHFEFQNLRIYLFSSLGNSALESAQAIAETAAGGMKLLPGDRRRLEIWAHATPTVPAHLVEIVGEFDPQSMLKQQLSLGSLLALDVPSDSLTPWSIGATWRVGTSASDAANDSDKDGLPDGWELRFGLNPRYYADALVDSDGDGVSNKQEFSSGTDPRNPASYFRVYEVNWSGSKVKVRFNTELGRQYQLQRTLSLDPQQLRWVPVSNFPGTAAPVITGTGGAIELSDTSPGTIKGFYRVVLIPE